LSRAAIIEKERRGRVLSLTIKIEVYNPVIMLNNGIMKCAQMKLLK
jgi:hypothetical protein